MCEEVVELCGPLANVRAPTQQGLKIAECVAAYNAGNMNKLTCIDEHDEEYRKWKRTIAMLVSIMHVRAMLHPQSKTILLKDLSRHGI